MSTVQYGSSPGAIRGRSWRALSLALARSGAEPWWWRHVDHGTLAFDFDYVLVVDPEGRPRSVFSWRFWRMCLRVIGVLFTARRQGYTYIFTGENDWTTFIVAGVQTVLRMRRPRHVIQQFIMREKTASLGSRAKYAFMKWCFSSVALCICSARSECDYYAQAFGWPSSKLDFVPFHTDPAFLDIPVDEPVNPGYAVSAGRTFRDYDTLIEAFRGLDVPLTIVGYRGNPADGTIPPNVALKRELPLAELTRLIAGSSIVILPLQDLQISIGQSVLLQAMALGKPVVVSRVSGTVDYIEHMKTGVLVPHGDAGAIRAAVQRLTSDGDLRRRIGSAALAQVRRGHLVAHYLQGVSRALERRFPRNGPIVPHGPLAARADAARRD